MQNKVKTLNIHLLGRSEHVKRYVERQYSKAVTKDFLDEELHAHTAPSETEQYLIHRQDAHSSQRTDIRPQNSDSECMLIS